MTCFDPDAPTGSGFWHWWCSTSRRRRPSFPAARAAATRRGCPSGAIHARNDGGGLGYLGVAPPEGHGDHRYVFAVHALGVPTLGIDSSASPAAVGFNMTFNTLGTRRADRPLRALTGQLRSLAIRRSISR